MKRILHVISSLHLGGSQSLVMNLYEKINRNDIQFDFVVFPEDREGLYEQIEELGGKIYQCPRYNGKNHLSYCHWWNAFFSAHDEYDIVHGHNRSTSAIYLGIAKRYGLVTISHSHSTSNGSGLPGLVKDIMQWPTRYIADYLFACSDDAGKWMFGSSVVKKTNYRVIRNGIDCLKFAFDASRREQMRIKLDVDNCFVVGNVGRITEPKNHKFLIDVFAEIYHRQPNARLLLVGDGDLLVTAKQQCHQLDIDQVVIFAGSQLNTKDFYQAMDIFVFPSLWEGLGIVAIEAQAAGLPVLISERVPEDVLLTDHAYRMQLAQGAAQWADKLLNMDTTADRSLGAKVVAKAGYDVSETAEWLQQFYLSKAKKG